jgi:uncharacterized protein YraI
MHKRTLLLLLTVLLILLVTACNLVSEQELESQIAATATADALIRPTIVINSPPNGTEVIVNTQVIVSVSASDNIGLTRVTLMANNQLVDSVTSQSPNGDRQINALLDFTPNVTGSVTLQAFAFRGSVSSDPATITLFVRENQQQVTATAPPQPGVPTINPNDPTCRALVTAALNVRSGPSTAFPVLTVLAPGSVVPIIGRVADNTWWQVRAGAIIGWVSAQFTNVYGNCTGIPIVASPPTPTSSAPTVTPSPTNTLPPLVPTATPLPANLIVTNISGPVTLSLGGNPTVAANYSVTITNLGGTATGPFNNTITVNPGGVPAQLAVVANLLPGESIILNSTVTFNSAGSFTLVVVADSDNQVPEISEVDNTGTLAVTVNS